MSERARNFLGDLLEVHRKNSVALGVVVWHYSFVHTQQQNAPKTSGLCGMVVCMYCHMRIIWSLSFLVFLIINQGMVFDSFVLHYG